MSTLDQTLFAAMDHPSEIVSVRQALRASKSFTLDRIDALSTLSKIDGDKELSAEMKAAAKRHEMTRAMDKIRAGDTAHAAAMADIVKAEPPIPAAETAGAASIDVELRTNFKALPEKQRESLLKNSAATRLALARAPAELSGLVDQAHSSLREGILRELYPEAMQNLDADRRAMEAAKNARDMFAQTARASFGTPIETHATRIIAA